MAENSQVRFHLEPSLYSSAVAGEHNFLKKVRTVLENAGMSVELCRNSDDSARDSANWPGYDLFHMEPPTHARAVTVRRVYRYPFWAIEQSAERWHWRVARTDFPGASDPAESKRFTGYWRKRLFGDVATTPNEEYVYVPLQGRIRERRSFQFCSPLDMIRAILKYDPARPVIATLHPNEHYSAADQRALEDLIRDNPRFSVGIGEMERHLARCDYVVTQNSAAAFHGYFFHKPAVLFARVDFHHIAANVCDVGAQEAFRQVMQMRPDYDGYIHWFWQEMSINAGRPEAEAQIAAALRACDWPV